MTFKIGTKIVSVKNASKIGTVVETGLPGPQGVQWVKIKWSNGVGKWILGDGIREYQSSRSVHVPNGVVVLKRLGHPPEVFQQPGSTATEDECLSFLKTILEMFLQKF